MAVGCEARCWNAWAASMSFGMLYTSGMSGWAALMWKSKAYGSHEPKLQRGCRQEYVFPRACFCNWANNDRLWGQL